MEKSACWVCPSRRAWFLPKSHRLGPLDAAWLSALAAGCRGCGNPTTVVGKGGRHPRVASQRAHALLTTHGDLDEVGVEVRRPLCVGMEWCESDELSGTLLALAHSRCSCQTDTCIVMYPVCILMYSILCLGYI